ncbi:hypothetical protein N410_08260 [Helicobacter pylori GC26]|nr:hypothetical protein N410_08260 [Helicobacter pylori GC26]
MLLSFERLGLIFLFYFLLSSLFCWIIDFIEFGLIDFLC